jgi:single-strand binding protein|nr:MAG TPA: Single strand binding protein [Caudoviricetes sp.]
MLNVVAIMGRMVKDPELKTTNSGKSVCSFRIANDSGYKDASGQSQTKWLDVTAWGKTAEFVCKYFPKGALIAIEGRLQSRNYQDKSGNNRNAVEVVVNNVSFAGNKEPAQSQNVANRAVSAPVAANNEYEPIEDDGDLPF